FALGGQDRHLLADQIFVHLEFFCLVEFKDNKAGLRKEAADKATRVIRLCTKLQGDERMRGWHDSAHFAAWVDNPGYLITDIYRHQICNRELLGENCGLH